MCPTEQTGRREAQRQCMDLQGKYKKKTKGYDTPVR